MLEASFTEAKEEKRGGMIKKKETGKVMRASNRTLADDNDDVKIVSVSSTYNLGKQDFPIFSSWSHKTLVYVITSSS